MGRHKKRVSSKSGTFNEVTTLSPTTDEVEAPLTVTSVSNATNPATEMTVVAPEDNTKEEIWPGGDIKSDEVVDTTTARESVPLNESEPIEHEIPVDEHNANHDNDDTIANVDGESSEKLDILGNGLITKQVVEKGLGRETRPNHGDVVTVSYQCWLDEDGTLVEDMPELTFTLGDGDVIHALDLAIPLAELKEKFELIADARFAYGVRGREPDIPGNARLRYHVRLLASDDPPQYTTMSGKERLTVADQKREKGNYYFRREEYESAMNSYMKALKILSPDSVDQTEVDPATTTASPVDVSPDCFHEMDTLILKLHNNLAATQLKIQAFDAAIRSCDIVLRKEPQNFKALFRKGRALIGLGNAEEAIPVLKQVLELVPHSAMAMNELQLARTMQQNERERWSRVASRMSSRRNQSNEKPASARSVSLCSMMRSRWILFVSALLFAFLSIGLAWYTEQFSRISIPWSESVEFH